MDLVLVGLVLPWLVVAVGCWIGYQLIRQNGRILLRLEELEQRLGHPAAAPAVPAAAPSGPNGLALGSAAPPFALPDLDGVRVALEQLRGRRVLLLFFNPTCGFCQQMAPGLAALPTDGAGGHPVPLVVSTGDPQQNRALVQQHGIRCPVLLQTGMEVASAYQASGTPMGYLLDEHGAVASEMAVGADAVLALARTPATSLPVLNSHGHAAAHTNGHAGGFGTRSLADSHITRDGLAAGTPAPAFRLPRLDGGELALEDYRGRNVLLVFSDPGCGPCNELAPRLEQVQRQRPELQVVMIGRGEAEANRAKVAEHGLSFPVVLQKQWELSRSYGMFATPIGYLIDEQGIIAADVAAGPDAILALTARGESDGSPTAVGHRNGKGGSHA